MTLKEKTQLQIININTLKKILPKDDWDVDLNIVPESCTESVNELMVLKDLAAGGLPKDLSSFSETEHILFQDRHVLSEWHYDQFTLDKVEQLADEQLKSDFTKLYNKINGLLPELPATSFFSKVSSFFIDSWLLKDTQEDWAYQFVLLKDQPKNQLASILKQKINTKSERLVSHLTVLEEDANQNLQLLVDKISFVEEKIVEQEKDSSILIKRFKNLDKLYDFEARLRTMPTALSIVPKIQEAEIISSGETEEITESEMFGITNRM